MANPSEPGGGAASPYWLQLPSVSSVPTAAAPSTGPEAPGGMSPPAGFDVLSIPGARQVLAPLGTAARPPAEVPPLAIPQGGPVLSPRAEDHPIMSSLAQSAMAVPAGLGWGMPAADHGAAATPPATGSVPQPNTGAPTAAPTAQADAAPRPDTVATTSPPQTGAASVPAGVAPGASPGVPAGTMPRADSAAGASFPVTGTSPAPTGPAPGTPGLPGTPGTDGQVPREGVEAPRPGAEPIPFDPRSPVAAAASGPLGLASGTPAVVIPMQAESPELQQPRTALEPSAQPHTPQAAIPMLHSQPAVVSAADQAGVSVAPRVPTEQPGASATAPGGAGTAPGGTDPLGGMPTNTASPPPGQLDPASAQAGGVSSSSSPQLTASPDAAPAGMPYFLQATEPAPTPIQVPETSPGPDKPRRAGVTRGPDGQAAQNPHRRDFPILRRRLRGKQLVWLDSSATAQKPQEVIDRVSAFYEDQNSNVHRGSHDLADEATTEYENARRKVQRFLGASRTEEIVFTRGCTESINLVANAFGGMVVGKGDQILVTELEHHSNIVPWKFLADRVGAVVRPIPINDRGEVKMAEYLALLTRKTKIVAFTQVSNSLGTILPAEEMVQQAHRAGAYVVVDGAQSVPHFAVNVQDLGCDFFAFSGHKLFGPSGVGALWGRKELLEQMPPWQGGGSMIHSVSFDEVVYAPVPAKFEAGTPILAGAVGLGAAIDYVERVGLANIAAHDQELLTHAVERLKRIKGVKIVAEPSKRTGAVSFVVNNFEAREVGVALNEDAIAVRAGHHCAQPSLAHFGLTATVRPSFALYNTIGEVDLLCEAVHKIARSRN